jgi:N-acetylmuramoyl-L-alanine amidase
MKVACGLAFFCILLLAGSVVAQQHFAATEAFYSNKYKGEILVIDPGHGGEDGGAVSSQGIVESAINLAIAKRLDGILGFYGVPSLMTRSEDISIYDEGAKTLREKKVSDLHNRVALIEAQNNATLISIHQNIYTNPKYHGAQVFYGKEERSMALASAVQETLRQVLDPENQRLPAKIPDSVYLMNHITCRGILVECGFLSNPEEEKLLQSPAYQSKIALALAGAYLQNQLTEEKEGSTGYAAQE